MCSIRRRAFWASKLCGLAVLGIALLSCNSAIPVSTGASGTTDATPDGTTTPPAATPAATEVGDAATAGTEAGNTAPNSAAASETAGASETAAASSGGTGTASGGGTPPTVPDGVISCDLEVEQADTGDTIDAIGEVDSDVALPSNLVFAIDFGDGTVVEGSSGQHTYTAPGSFAVALTWSQAGVSHTVPCGQVEIQDSSSGDGSNADVDDQGATDVDTDQFVGLGVQDAEALADSLGLPSRVVKSDGQDLQVTADFLANRVNFVVDDNVVECARFDPEADELATC